MRVFKFEANGGMVAATVLLVVGGVMVLGPGQDDPSLHVAGVRIVMLAGVVYLIARIVMFVRQLRG